MKERIVNSRSYSKAKMKNVSWKKLRHKTEDHNEMRDFANANGLS
jgi:hypothetical protein